MPKKVTVIIPNYNGLKFMEPCFEALGRQNYKDYQVLVIDNGSGDGSVDWLKEKGIPSVFLEENTGFSGAVNIGIKAADTPYVLLLNNDTEVQPDFVGELVRAIDSSPRIFSVSSKMIQLSHRDLMDDAGDMFSVLGWAYQRGVGQSVSRYQKPYRIFSACAGAAIYRRAVFDEIGVFDPLHFAYLEDIDVGYRAQLYGYKNIYCPTAVVFHVGSGTSGSKYNSFKVKLASRNTVYLIYKNMPFLQIFINLLPILAGVLLKYQFFKNIGFEKDYLDGIREGIKTLSRCRRVKLGPGCVVRYLKMELFLIWGTFLYVYEFSTRKLENSRKKFGNKI